MSFEYIEQFKYPTCVCLNITNNCNLACKYCFVQQKPQYMTKEIAFKSIDFVATNLLKKRELEPRDNLNGADVTFFGGEPTLLWEEIIIPTVLYAEEKYPNLIHFSITTNGTLLDDQKIEFLKEHYIPILLSIDGNKEVQDFNRPSKDNTSSFDKVSKNIPKILEAFPLTTFRTTIYQDTCNKLYESYKFAENSGFTNIFLCPNAREQWTEENLNNLQNEIHKIFADFIAHFLIGQYPIECGPIKAVFKKILQHDLQIYNNNFQDLEINRGVSRCGIGTGSAAISYNGDIFGCQEQNSRSTNEYFYIGNIFSGIDVDLHLKLLKDYNKKAIIKCEDETECINCPLRTTCVHDICPSVTHDLFNNFFTRPKIDCLFYKWLMEDAIVAMDFLVNKKNNELFKEYLNNLYKEFEIPKEKEEN